MRSGSQLDQLTEVVSSAAKVSPGQGRRFITSEAFITIVRGGELILHDSMTGCVATCTHGLDYIKLVFSCLITFNSELELGIYNIKLVVWFH